MGKGIWLNCDVCHKAGRWQQYAKDKEEKLHYFQCHYCGNSKLIDRW